MMRSDRIKEIFYRTGAIITDSHFVYAKKADGWYHGSEYVNKDAVYPCVAYARELCQYLVGDCSRQLMDGGWVTVVGPTIGGVILSQWVAYWLSKSYGQPIYAVFAEEANDKRIIKRGYNAYVTGKKCFIVEDIINSGATICKTRDAVLECKGQVVGVGALCNRSGGKVTAETLAVPFLSSLMNIDMKMYKEEECPICKDRGIESVRADLGKGRDFLIRMGKCPT